VVGQPADAAHVALPAPAEVWFQNGPEIEFPVDDVVSPVPQPNNFSYQWPGQMFHMPG
jgi:hypothetical protein